MKRKLFLLPAIALVVLLSAFTLSKRDVRPADASFYWYKVVGAKIDHLQPVNGGVATTKTYLLAHVALIPCPVGFTSDCIRGFVMPQTTDPSSGQADAIKKP